MDVQNLVRRFYALQTERVEAYHLLEEGHQAYLRSGPDYDFLRYRQLVHEITLAFNGISQEILQIKENLEGPHGRKDLAEHLGRIQEKEQEKLELTAQLQLAKQNVQDQPGVEAHAQEANSNHRSNQRNSSGFQVRFGRKQLTGRPVGEGRRKAGDGERGRETKSFSPPHLRAKVGPRLPTPASFFRRARPMPAGGKRRDAAWPPAQRSRFSGRFLGPWSRLPSWDEEGRGISLFTF
ncbi:putative C19orf60-like protein [Naja naja]|nr:putative C19orf60-like protein [Naja naja]